MFNRIWVFLIFLPVSVIAMGQELVVSDGDDNKVEVELENLVGISYKDSTLVASYSDGKDESYKVSDISEVSYSASGGDGVSAMDGRIVYVPSSAMIVVAKSVDKRIVIYNLGGTQVIDRKIESQIETISLDSLGKGVYLLKLEGKTIKIVR
ncbi:MAG: T9SS type A sorting domain-containing protein [Bacteroidaceae bacterium]|nr:T9SS type A sorting domain-containing protein [Bacteroidaceae bacterium]